MYLRLSSLVGLNFAVHNRTGATNLVLGSRHFLMSHVILILVATLCLCGYGRNSPTISNCNMDTKEPFTRQPILVFRGDANGTHCNQSGSWLALPFYRLDHHSCV